ncbi:MAG: hypothetical protein U0736_15790 [Gemmataceae bacterium]
MTLPLEFHSAVRDEIDDAHAWYEQRRAGLGAAFLDEVERVLAEITANPARYGFAETDIREGLLTRFPYTGLSRGKSARSTTGRADDERRMVAPTG